MSPDLINAAFEFIGASFQVRNTFQILRDKEVKGVFWPAWLFFTLWSFWNLFYYPSFGQWWSFFAGVVMFIANLFWVSLAWHYSRKR